MDLERDHTLQPAELSSASAYPGGHARPRSLHSGLATQVAAVLTTLLRASSSRRCAAALLAIACLAGFAGDALAQADTTPPTLVSATLDGGRWITLTFSEDLDETQRIAISDFRVRRGGDNPLVGIQRSPDRPQGRTVTLELYDNRWGTGGATI